MTYNYTNSFKHWAERQRATNKLVRECTGYLIEKYNDSLTPQQIYGLCKLTWITDGNNPYNISYIKSTKIPALEHVFGQDYKGYSLNQVAKNIAIFTKKEILEDLINTDTGFTNFYKAFRNSSEEWINNNINLVKKLVILSYKATSDNETRQIIKQIENLPYIQKENNNSFMSPERILTPLFFSLDERKRFPLINGKNGIKELLKKLNKHNASLVDKFDCMISLIGTGDIHDAADLDMIEDINKIDVDKNFNIKIKLGTKLIDKSKPLSIKDENDIEIIKQAITTECKRRHNQMTNLFKNKFTTYVLEEGGSSKNMFDILVRNYDSSGRDLLIEVKSSTNMPEIRMAVGQLLDYSRQLPSREKTDLAVLLPTKPNSNIKDFLDYCTIGMLWFSEGKIYTYTNLLKKFTL